MYRILRQEGRAKRAELTTVHGVIQTPVFMNVGTVAAIKGAVATSDLEEIGTQALYHLVPGTHMQMIRIGKLHLGSYLLQI